MAGNRTAPTLAADAAALPPEGATAALGAARHPADIDWLALLRAAIEQAGRGGVTRVALRLGVSRPYVSRVLHGDFNPVPQQFIARVIDRLHVVAHCPATLQPQPRSECRRLALGPVPMHNPLSMRIWKCCQTCPDRPEERQ